MKKVIKGFQKPTEAKDLTNYINRKGKYSRNRMPDRARRLRDIESAGGVDRPSWWHDLGYDIHGRPIPDPEEIDEIAELDFYIEDQRVVVDDKGDAELVDEDIMNWDCDEIETEYYTDDPVSIIEDFLFYIDKFIQFPKTPGNYKLNCYVDLIVNITDMIIDNDGSVIDKGDWKLDLDESSVSDIEFIKVD